MSWNVGTVHPSDFPIHVPRRAETGFAAGCEHPKRGGLFPVEWSYSTAAQAAKPSHENRKISNFEASHPCQSVGFAAWFAGLCILNTWGERKANCFLRRAGRLRRVSICFRQTDITRWSQLSPELKFQAAHLNGSDVTVRASCWMRQNWHNGSGLRFPGDKCCLRVQEYHEKALSAIRRGA